MTEKYLTIDLHNHYHPKETAQLAVNVDGTNFQAILKQRPKFLGSRTHDIELRLKLMDAAGVDMVILNQTPWSPQGLEMCKTINNGIAKVAREHPDRFIPCCHIPLENNIEVLDEMNRGINEF